MSRSAWIVTLLAVAALLVGRLLWVERAAVVHVRVDAATRHQTIEGFGARIYAPEVVDGERLETAVPPRDQLQEILRRAARELRLAHLAVELPQRFEVVNDDADPFAFAATADDERVVRELGADHLAAFRDAVASEGGTFSFEVHERREHQPAWRRACPPEAREHVRALLERLATHVALRPRRWVVLDETGSAPAPDGDPQLPDLGPVPVVHAPAAAPRAPALETLFEALQSGATRWNAPKLYQLGRHPDAEAFFTAPTEGGFALEGPSYWELRQVTFHVPAGSMRIGCASDAEDVDALAFEHEERTVVVLANLARPRAARNVHLHGLRPGRYAVSVVENGRPPTERGLHEVPASGELALAIPGRSVVALAAHPGPNQRPTITRCEARPAMPLWDERIELLGLAADPEDGPLTYRWEALEHPADATLAFHSPDARATRVTGLKPTGRYRFRFTVRDEQGARDVRDLIVEHPAGPVPTFPGALRTAPLPPRDVHDAASVTLHPALHPIPPSAGTFQWTLADQPPGARANLTPGARGTAELRVDDPVPGRYRIRCLPAVTWVPSDGGWDLAPSAALEHTVFVWPSAAHPLELVGEVRPRPEEPGAFDLLARTNLPDELPVARHWTLAERPEGSDARIAWSRDAPPRLVDATRPGRYRLHLELLGARSVGSVAVELRIPGADGR